MKLIKIALICAHPAGTNSGMISVDVSFQTIKNILGNSIEFTRFCAWRNLSKGDLLNYEHYYDPNQLNDYDAIIFWGDFLQWLGYAEIDWLEKSKKMNLNLSDCDIINLWYSLFLFENREDLRKKTIMFGGTFYGINSKQISNNRYFSAINCLIKDSLLIKVRDVLSANFVMQMKSNSNPFGCDCAFLLEDTYLNIPKSNNNEPYFLYSFSRSGKKDELLKFVYALENKLKIKAKEISWISKGAGISKLEENLSLIKHSKFVLTDIYHLAVNSLREKIPIICIGTGASTIENTISDKKKEILFHQIFGNDYYIFLEEILKSLENSDLLDQLLDRVYHLINDDLRYFSMLKILDNQITASKLELIKVISSLQI